MSVESATTIATLDATLPAATDPKSEGDDHIRLLKAVAKADAVSLSSAQTITAPKRGTVTTDNDASLDLTVTNNFSVTPTGSATLTFTNIGSASGQSGFIKLVNGSNYTISAAATTKINTTDLTQVSQTGTYICSYFCDGTNVFVVSSRSFA